MKKGFRKVCAALCSTALLCAATAVPASASTVSDVIAAAYAVGIPAQYVQEGIAMYGGGNYTSEQCDQAIASIYSYQGRVDELLEDYFGVPSNGGGNNNNASDNNSNSSDNNNSGSNSGGNSGSSGNNSNSSSNSNSSNNANSGNNGGTSGDSDVGVKTCAINLACITYYIYAYHNLCKKHGNSSGIAYVHNYLK